MVDVHYCTVALDARGNACSAPCSRAWKASHKKKKHEFTPCPQGVVSLNPTEACQDRKVVERLEHQLLQEVIISDLSWGCGGNRRRGRMFRGDSRPGAATGNIDS